MKGFAAADVRRSRSVSGALHRLQCCSFHGLFSRMHSGRDFGGLWFRVYTERGPC